MSNGQHGHIHSHLRHLADDKNSALGMAGHDQEIWFERLDLGQRGRHVRQLLGQLVIDDNFHIIPFRILEYPGADVHRERIVLHRHGHFDITRFPAGLLELLGDQINRLGQILLGRGQNGE